MYKYKNKFDENIQNNEKNQNKRTVGTEYERLACEYLLKEGYRILERNFRCRQGEVDIIARDGKYLVFIEVKYRKSLREGDPAEAVDYHKQTRILRTARFYMTYAHIPEDTPCRFDVVAVLGNDVRLIKDAFWC